MTTGPADYTRPEYEVHIRHNSLFTGGNVRAAVQDGRADYSPVFLSEVEGLFCSGPCPSTYACCKPRRRMAAVI